MSIIDAFKEKRRMLAPMSQRNNKIEENDEANQMAKILDVSRLEELVSKVIDYHTTKEEYPKESRTFQHVWDVNLQNILGYVDEPTWVHMIESYIEWCRDSKEAVQPNGRWAAIRHEIKRERRMRHSNRTVGKNADGRAEILELKTPYDVLVVGIEFVDLANELDMVYEMGRPATRKDSFDPRVIREMMMNQMPGQSEEQIKKISEQEEKLEEQAKLIKQLKNEQKRAAVEQNKTNELLAGLLSELKEQKSGRSASTRKK